MARLCEGPDCGKRVGIPAERGESWTDPSGLEHDYCRACWEKPVLCPVCQSELKRNDPRVVQASLPGDTLQFLHGPCRDHAARQWLIYLHTGVVPPVIPAAPPMKREL